MGCWGVASALLYGDRGEIHRLPPLLSDSHDRRLPPISHCSPAPHPRSPQWRGDPSILDKAEANYRHHPAINELPRRKNSRRLQRSRPRGYGCQIPCRHFSCRAQGLASWRYSQQVGRQNTVYVSRWLHFGPALLNKQICVPLTPDPCPLALPPRPACSAQLLSTIDTPQKTTMGYHAERTVAVYNQHGHSITLAKYHATTSVAKRRGWRPGVTHSKWVGSTRYVFQDGCTSAAPCSTSQLVKR